MLVDVVLLPSLLQPSHLHERSVVVFDVLRATTTMATALAGGAKEIRVFASLEDARLASQSFDGPHALCGELNALPPAGFDFGNSPGDFSTDRISNRTLFMSTTNGTRAIVAAQSAARCFAAALVNARATAAALVKIGRDVTLLCSGTQGEISPEDLTGCGAVLAALESFAKIDPGENVPAARDALASANLGIVDFFRETQAGHNIRRVKLDADIEFAACLDLFDLVAEITGPPPIVRVAKI